MACAAAWIARLHADDRGEADVAAFRAWLSRDAAHGAAFDRVSLGWEAAGGLRRELGAPPRGAPDWGQDAAIACSEGLKDGLFDAD